MTEERLMEVNNKFQQLQAYGLVSKAIREGKFRLEIDSREYGILEHALPVLIELKEPIQKLASEFLSDRIDKVTREFEEM